MTIIYKDGTKVEAQLVTTHFMVVEGVSEHQFSRELGKALIDKDPVALEFVQKALAFDKPTQVIL
jgi:hypothetical protein